MENEEFRKIVGGVIHKEFVFLTEDFVVTEKRKDKVTRAKAFRCIDVGDVLCFGTKINWYNKTSQIIHILNKTKGQATSITAGKFYLLPSSYKLKSLLKDTEK